MGKLTHTVKGSIASFRSADVAPIESLKLHFLPKQEGSGNPSLTNIRPITGWTGCNLFGSGMNLWDEEWELGTFNNDTGEKNPPSNRSIRSKNYIPCKPSTTYYLRHPIQSNDCHLYFYGKNKEYIDHIWKWPGSFTTPSNCYYIRFYMHSTYGITYLNNIGINYPSKSSYVTSVGNKNMEISWSDHGVEYGGYIDPVRGKLVATWEVISKPLSQWTHAAPTSIRYYADFAHDMKCVDDGVYGNSQKCNIAPFSWSDIENANPHFFVGRSSSKGRAYLYLPADYDGSQVIQVAAKLVTPIEYDIDPISLQTFLDYNNFWSDTNDDTEVEYCFADRLSIRKSLMVPETKLADWNQLIKDGNFTGNSIDGARWRAFHNNEGTLSISDNVATWECVEVPAYYYQAGITWTYGSHYNYLQIPYNHKLYVRVDMRCSKAVSGRIYALVANGMHKYNIAIPIEANTWTTIRGMLPERVSVQTGEDDGIVKRFRTCIAGLNNMSDITIGTTYDVKNFMAFDLTQMFGLGNEPQTVAEFEHICEINGIDLTTYQPYDEGSDRWLIIP